MEELKKNKKHSEILFLFYKVDNKEATAKDIIVTTHTNIKVTYKHVMIRDIVNWKFFNIKKI